VSQFGSDPNIVNKSILLDNESYQVVGVLPAGGAFDRAPSQIWRPLAFEPSNMTRNFHWLTSFAKLKAGVSLQQAKANMDTIGKRIERDFPDSNRSWGVVVERYADTLIAPDLRSALLVLLIATGMVLLIGCANLANLALVRGVAREREVAVRASLGARRWQLIRQFLTETVLLSIWGGLLGIAIGYGTLKWLQSQLPPFTFAREINVTMDYRVLLFAMAIAVFTGVLFGLAPAMQLTSPNLAMAMKDGGRGASTGGSRRRLRDVLVIAEVSLAFILLAGSGLMMRTFFGLMNAESGFDATNTVTVGMPVALKRLPDPKQLNAYLREIRAAVEAVPGVVETALSCAPPMQGSCYGMPMQVAGRPMVERANRDGGFYKIVSPSYFTAMRLKLIKGRGLSEQDAKGAPPVLVMNERLAKRYFPTEDPIGKHVLIQEIVPGKTALGEDVSWEVVGVVASEKIGGPRDEQSAGVYVSNEQSPAYGMTLIVRAKLDPLTLPNAIRAAIHSVNKDQPLGEFRTVDQIKEQALVGNRLQATLLGIFGAVALLLAALGIYGVISYSVEQRTHELGIRAALGASGGSLLGLVLMRGLVLTGIGLAIGLAGSLAVTRQMKSLLFGVGAQDPMTMAAVAAVLAAVAITACYLPSRRATRADPLVALRYE
jgi:predicted permease